MSECDRENLSAIDKMIGDVQLAMAVYMVENPASHAISSEWLGMLATIRRGILRYHHAPMLSAGQVVEP